MKQINEFRKYVLYGGGVMAERLSKQLKESGMKLVAVADNYDIKSRKRTEYCGYKICNLAEAKSEVDEDTCVILAINAFFSLNAISYYEQVFDGNFEKLFVPNPYTCLRPCVMNDDFAKEVRTPVDNPIYKMVRNLFSDEVSLDIFDRLWKSKTYDSKYDSFELINYLDVKDVYYFGEAYWDSYNFSPTKEQFATVFDCGAYIGDSIKPVCSVIPEKKVLYYAFEPEEENANSIRKNFEFQKICDEIRVLEYGVGDENKELFFEFPDNNQKDAGRFVNSPSKENGLKLTIKRIDDLNLEIKGQLYIKMDIEGSEMAALMGAKETIKRHKPYLAICVYHRKNDLTAIPSFIASLGCEYDYYLRGGFHTILWAIPKK